MIPLETLDKMLETAKKGGAVVGFTKEQAVELIEMARDPGLALCQMSDEGRLDLLARFCAHCQHQNDIRRALARREREET